MRANNGKRQFHKKSLTTVLVLTLAFIVIIGGAVGGTLAWLTAKTDEVKNTFSTSDIGVTLTETTTDYKMIPGWTIAKDPKATVTSGSEDCYLFVKVVKSENFDTYMDMAIDTQWTALDEKTYPGVYYIKIDEDSEKNVAYNVLGAGSATYDDVPYTWAANQVLVKPTVTKTMMAELTSNPTLTFTAYAVQLYKNNSTEFTVSEAWALAQTLNTAN